MNCYTHPDRPAVGVCVSCGKALCETCVNKVGERLYCGTCSGKLTVVPSGIQTEGRNKIAAGLLGILLGGLGAHKFYLGQIGLGILYLIFCWTFIPAIIGLIEGIVYLSMSDADFNAKYNRPAPPQGNTGTPA